jgi:hypothetical protein
MRLLRLEDNDTFSLVEILDGIVPPYAILSHTWGADSEEVTFEDMTCRKGAEKAGYRKIWFCATQARKDHLDYIWVDSCCIDRKSSSELSEAINSMFRWYQKADICYVYLADVTTELLGDTVEGKSWNTAFEESRWFTRGWTLQELIAPRLVEFFSRDGVYLGSKSTLEGSISRITGMPVEVLQGDSLLNYSVSVRMTWASKRRTKRVEDAVYCQLGLFDVTMPLVYGEGLKKAMKRLENEIKDALSTPFTGVFGSREMNPDELRRLQESLLFSRIDARKTAVAAANIRTCDWFLHSSGYATWQDDTKLNEHHGILWVKGNPGTGKSTLMKYALENTERATGRSVIVSFFFSARGRDCLERSTVGLYRALLAQILERRPDLVDVLKETPVMLRTRILNTQEWDIESLKAILEATVRKFGSVPLICFIDALDEVEDWQIRDMVAFFERLGQVALDCKTALRVCFASRYYPHISVGHAIELRLEREAGHDQDIVEYISSELRIGKGETAQRIREEMQIKASGIFMWTVLVVRILNREYDRGRVWALQRRLDELPGDLHELFRDMLTRDSHSQDDLILCIQWILYSETALSPEQLYYGVLSESRNEYLGRWSGGNVLEGAIERFVLDVSKGLVEINRVGEPKVQFIHESVKDFLIKGNGMQTIGAASSSNWLGESHERLKCCCARQLKDDFDQRSTLSLLPTSFVGYASKSVLYHANLASRHGISQTDFLASFQPDWIYRNRTPTTLLYMLGEQNRESLISDSLEKLECFRSEPSNYGTPMFAALGYGNHEATVAFVRAQAERLQTDDPLKDLCRSYDKTEILGRPLIGLCVSPQPATIVMVLAQYGDEILFALAVRVLKCTVDVMNRGIGHTPLMLAILQANASMVKAILQTAIYSINLKDNGLGRPPLTWAVEEGSECIVQLLLENSKTDINLKDTKYGRSPLSWAAQSGRAGIVTALLQADNIEVDSMDYNGRTALSWAADYGHQNICRILLEVGRANKILKDRYGRTPYQWAVCSRQQQVAELLLQ